MKAVLRQESYEPEMSHLPTAWGEVSGPGFGGICGIWRDLISIFFGEFGVNHQMLARPPKSIGDVERQSVLVYKVKVQVARGTRDRTLLSIQVSGSRIAHGAQVLRMRSSCNQWQVHIDMRKDKIRRAQSY
jgi:hypothetical protein